MLGVLAAAVVVPLAVAAALVVLAALAVVPFVVACDMAERRGFPAARWGAVALGGSAFGLAVGYLGLRNNDLPNVIGVLPLALTWTGPGVLWLLEGSERWIGGRRGAHE